MDYRWWCLLACVAVAIGAGFGCQDMPGVTLSESETDAEPCSGVDALVTVAADLYRREGQDRIVFLSTDTEAVDADKLFCVMTRLAADLGVRVLPAELADRTDPSVPALTPVDPATGETGISIHLADVIELEVDQIQVRISFARSALDGAIFEYVLACDGAGWTIVARQRVAVS